MERSNAERLLNRPVEREAHRRAAERHTHANRPISIEILAQIRDFAFGTAAAFSVLLIAVVLAFTAIARLVGAQGRVELTEQPIT